MTLKVELLIRFCEVCTSSVESCTVRWPFLPCVSHGTSESTESNPRGGGTRIVARRAIIALTVTHAEACSRRETCRSRPRERATMTMRPAMREEPRVAGQRD